MSKYRTLLAGAALANLSSSIMFADNDAGDTNAGGGGEPAKAGAPAADAAPAADTSKQYAVTAQLKNPKAAAEDVPKEVSYMIVADDYKLAWQDARAVTREGTAELGDKIKVLTADGKEGFAMKPGRYTVKEVKSLTQRGKKAGPVTIDQLESVLAERGIKPSKQVLELIEELKSNPGPLLSTTATTPQAEAAAG